MRLKTLTLKGFKSFPERTQLDFGPGVSVVVGPNGSGKSNITDAVLWAMGEQSPLAVRGSSMQDVIFGGAPGVQARTGAEVEIVLENGDGGLDLPLSEVSIVRTLDRTGEGCYRLNGARCRLSDVIEALSDTGLGKETHSVISQGRVEEIVTSKPRDRRLLIEEAAGLGKHRKRRRRAELKLERTQQNLDRALDVEREARTRLRPLKRQAEAAELHARLERQTLEARLELVRDRASACGAALREAERRAAAARAASEKVERSLVAMSERRADAERHDALTARAFQARSARERLQMREEQARRAAEQLRQRMHRSESELRALGGAAAQDPRESGGEGDEERIEVLQAELAEIQANAERELERELGELEHACAREQQRVGELDEELARAREARARADQLVAGAREGSVWSATWEEVRRVITAGVQRVLRAGDERAREDAAAEVAAEAEQVARGVVEYALKGVRAAEEVRERAELALSASERSRAEASQELARTQWLIERRREAAQQGPLAVRRAQLEGELAAERRQLEQLRRARAERASAAARLRAQHAADALLLPGAERLATALAQTAQAAEGWIAELDSELVRDSAAGEQMTAELRACAAQESEIQAQLREAAEAVTEAEVAAQRLRDQAEEARLELRAIAERLELPPPEPEQAAGLQEEQVQAIEARIERLQRRREQLGPVNPLAGEEYSEAVAHVEEMEARRSDLEDALRELRAVIAEADREIQRTFNETFQAAADNFGELVADLFPGGSGRLRLVAEEQAPRTVLGGQALPAPGARKDNGATPGSGEEAEAEELEDEGEGPGVEIEITPAGKTAKRLSLLSGGEKSMTALAFLFAVFLARPCPFYILDEVEAALDDLNLDRFLALLRRYSDRAQFIVITHQKRTMEAADWLYGVSMGGDGVSKVVSRRLPAERTQPREVAALA